MRFNNTNYTKATIAQISIPLVKKMAELIDEVHPKYREESLKVEFVTKASQSRSLFAFFDISINIYSEDINYYYAFSTNQNCWVGGFDKIIGNAYYDSQGYMNPYEFLAALHDSKIIKLEDMSFISSSLTKSFPVYWTSSKFGI